MIKGYITKKFFLTSILISLCINTFADVYTYSFTAKVWSSYGDQALGTKTWTAAATGGAYWGYDSTKGQQFGSTASPATALSLTTSGISGTITSVKVNTSGASSIVGTFAVSVGGTAFTIGSATSQTLTSTATDYTFTGSSSGSIVLSWTQTSTKALYIKSIEVTYSAAPTCTASNLAFAQSSISKLVSDGAFTQTATSLNGTTAITYSSSNQAVATVNETTGLVTPLTAGSTTITATQAAGTHNTVNYCAATATYTVDVATTAPTITVTEVTVPTMTAYAGASDTENIQVSGSNLTADISLAISGTNANLFSLSTNSVTQPATVIIYYNPTAPGTHTATLTLSSAGATNVVRTLNGSSTWQPLQTPVATPASNVSNTGFTANWDAVVGATEYTLAVNSVSGGSQKVDRLTENFDLFTAGQPNASADATDKSADLNSLTQTQGWSGIKVYQAGGAVKLGTSSALGYLITPTIDLSSNGGAFTISFKAMAWSGDSTKIKIYLNDVLITTVTGLPNSASYTLGSFNINLNGGSVNSVFKFEGLQAAKGRFFIDDLVISQGGDETLTPIAGSPFTVTGENSKTFAGLESAKTYKYNVVAKNTNVTSAVSNTISVTTSPNTGLRDPKVNGFAYVTNGTVIVNTAAGNRIEIFNAMGQLLTSRIAGTNNKISLSEKGVIIVKAGGKATKLIL